LYPRPVRRRSRFLTATPPQHESALILSQVRECLGATCLADSSFARYQHQLALTCQHAVKRRPKYIKFARPTDDRSVRISARGCQLAHADLILPRYRERQAVMPLRPALGVGSIGRLFIAGNGRVPIRKTPLRVVLPRPDM